MNDKFYVYIQIDPVTQAIRYVGKGTGRRAWTYKGRSIPHRLWMQRVVEPIVQIMERFENEEAALALEEKLIAEYRSAGHDLYNLMSSGRGRLGAGHKGKFGSRHPRARQVYRSDGRSWPSVVDCEAETGHKKGGIYDSIRRGTAYHGFLYSYSDI